MEKKKIVIGLSGGVDSAVAAHLLQIQGYEVHGLLLRVPHAICPENDAKIVADHLGIGLYVADVAEIFTKNVIAYFCKEYQSGATPNPCVLCNPTVKFKTMEDYADKISAKWMATGHYAGTKRQGANTLLIRDLNSEKDQSYMLHRLPQEILRRTIFPLFQMEKSEVRKIAAENGIPVAAKRDSQEICFVPDDDYLSFLTGEGMVFEKGNFVDRKGEILGTHRGIGAYTVGQRKGLGIASQAPLYVQEIDAMTHQVVLGDEKGLFQKEIICDQVFFSAFAELEQEIAVSVKVRLSKKEEKAVISPLGDGKVRILFDTAVRAPSKGQFAVFYQGDLVLGGGRIF